MNERDNLWRRVICAKYGIEGFGWYPSNPNDPYGLNFGDTSAEDGELFLPISN